MTLHQRKVAIITGSSSGIGAAIARALSNAGVAVVINSSHSKQEGENLAAALPEAIYCQADVSDETQCIALVDQTIERWGRLDILINNAAYQSLRIPHDDLKSATDEMFLNHYKVNVMGAWYLARAALPFLEKSDAGSIINISSVAGLQAVGSSIPYGVSKAALNHLTKFLAKVAGPNVRVNAIAPGFVDTPRTAVTDMAEMREMFSQQVPLERLGKPEDIASAVIGVINSHYMTGEIIRVDGGWHL